MDYQLILQEHPGYLHATVLGDNTPDNAARFLREAYAACVDRGLTSVLLEMNLSGPSLEGGEIFRVIADGAASGKLLKRIAYVERSERNRHKAQFAETVARNRGVNVRLFSELADAKRWLAGEA